MNNTFKYATYIVAFSLVWLVGENLLGYHNTIVDWLPFTSLLWLLLINLSSIFFLKTIQRNNSTRSFGTDFKALLRLSIYWLMGFAVIKTIYYQFINPDYFNDLLLRGREWLTMSATSDDNFEKATQMMEDLLQLPTYLLVTTVIQLVFCFVFSLLIPAFSKRN